ncbi:hypothetical protein MIZ01_0398 [Sideroxyarcus emersonii]|uniref:Uncharacterized protein n=2 Tax=Sideroxyarcus emersonii TaxID=2764705 RepID=A0AAN2BY01_9PROT|nr:hypothetical protein MIZ01_0398 [Sideroxyarcus emersonii]
MGGLALCSVEGCKKAVQKQGHVLCYEHWKAKHRVEEESAIYQVSKDSDAPNGESNGMLSATALGEHFKLDAKQINRVLVDLGWIEKEGKGWKPTELGEKLKAQKNIYFKNKIPYVVWHPDICKSRILQKAVDELVLVEIAPPVVTQNPLMTEGAADKSEEGFRERFPPTIRASDGHMVRSRGEAMIDGLLYENRIVHAYERLVPIEQTMYCDFFLPEFNLYIEFWGMESNPKYKERKERKLEMYRQNGLKLIEVKDGHINNLEDYLMGQLVKFGYKPK